jgi:hypothetical protein
MSENKVNERIYIAKGTILGFLIFALVLAIYVITEVLELNSFNNRILSAVMGSAIILLLFGFIIDQLSYRGFNFWAFGAIVSLFGVLIFFSPVLLYGLNYNDFRIWIVLVIIGTLFIVFGYTIEAYDINNRLAKILLNLWDAIISFQWQKIPGRIVILISAIFLGFLSYIIGGFRQFKSLIVKFSRSSFNFCKTSIEKTIKVVLEVPDLFFRMIRLFFDHGFWLLIPTILVFILNDKLTTSEIAFLPLQISLVILFLIALGTSNQKQIQRITVELKERSWQTMQSISIKIQETKNRLGKYTCTKCNKKINLDQKMCENCSTEIKTCTICKLQIKSDQTQSTCSMCKYPSHSNHWDQWIRMGRNCPICNSVVN